MSAANDRARAAGFMAGFRVAAEALRRMAVAPEVRRVRGDRALTAAANTIERAFAEAESEIIATARAACAKAGEQ